MAVGRAWLLFLIDVSPQYMVVCELFLTETFPNVAMLLRINARYIVRTVWNCTPVVVELVFGNTIHICYGLHVQNCCIVVI